MCVDCRGLHVHVNGVASGAAVAALAVHEEGLVVVSKERGAGDAA